MPLQDKKNFNGNIGESRTNQILSEKFLVSTRSVDIDGADFIVEIPFEETQQFRDFKETGVVQAKFFEKNNEVKIAKHYVFDEDGLRTNFFAIIHTNDKLEKKRRYFFTSQDIHNELKLRIDPKTTKEYYIFSLTKKRTFSQYLDFIDNEINRIIEKGILETEDYKRQKFITEVEQRFKEENKKVFELNNSKLFENIDNDHIVDKLYTCLNYFEDFRRITTWRLIDKISFPDKRNTSTFYNQFQLKTNNSEIIQFFKNLKILNSVEIVDQNKFDGVSDYKFKSERIITKLNENLVIYLDNLNDNETIEIRKIENNDNNSLDDFLHTLNFQEINKVVLPNNRKNDFWTSLNHAYALIQIGKYNQAKEKLEIIVNRSKESKQSIVAFFAKSNLRLIAWRVWDNQYPNLDNFINKLPVSKEKKDILFALSDGSLTNDYGNSIDELYLKIKDYKERKVSNHTATIVNELYCKYGEYVNFIEGNFYALDTYAEYKKITEKVIESLLISYSMRNPYYKHLEFLNDFMLRIIIHHCDSNNLIKWLQRNNISTIKYETENRYLDRTINSFFSDANLDFLALEINYIGNRTNNPDLRRKTENAFKNLCILVSYIENEIENYDLINKAISLISKLDIDINTISVLAHPLLRKPSSFSNKSLLDLLILLIQKKHTDGYIITNCLIALNKNQFKFSEENQHILELIENISIEKPSYGIFSILPKLLDDKRKEKFSENIKTHISSNFNSCVFEEAITNDLITSNEVIFEQYLESFREMKNSGSYLLFGYVSPYIGIDFRLAERLNALVNVIYTLKNFNCFDHPVIHNIRKISPYYNYILSKNEEGFKCEWLLENQFPVLLENFSTRQEVRSCLEQSLNNEFNKELGKIYLKFFN